MQKLNHAHHHMILWVMSNPGATLREMGAHFGYTIPWLCQVVNSDMFKAQLAIYMGEVEALVVADIPTKLKGVASLAVDRMAEVLQKTDDNDTIIDAFDKVMHRYGYAPNAKNGAQTQGPAVNTQNNIFYLTPDQLSGAREKLIENHARPALDLPVESSELMPAT